MVLVYATENPVLSVLFRGRLMKKKCFLLAAPLQSWMCRFDGAECVCTNCVVRLHERNRQIHFKNKEKLRFQSRLPPAMTPNVTVVPNCYSDKPLRWRQRRGRFRDPASDSVATWEVSGPEARRRYASSEGRPACVVESERSRALASRSPRRNRVFFDPTTG